MGLAEVFSEEARAHEQTLPPILPVFVNSNQPELSCLIKPHVILRNPLPTVLVKSGAASLNHSASM